MGFVVKVREDDCIGCGACAAVCPEIFDLRDGKVVVKTPKIKNVSCADEASDTCPVNCIEVKKE